MSAAGFIKGAANFIVPVQGSLKRADTYLDAVAGNSNSLIRAGAGLVTGAAYGKMAFSIATESLPASYREAVSEWQQGHEIESAGTVLLEMGPQVLATGLLAANGAAQAIRGFVNDARASSDSSV